MREDPTPVEVTIEVDPAYSDLVDAGLIEAVVARVLRHEGIADPLDVAIWITNEDELHELNRTYRGVDHTTDVLSFGTEDADAPFVNLPDEARHLGDLAISYPHVERQAEQFGHSAAQELAWLVAHGMLHLLGYDHELPEEEQEMQAREVAALGELGPPATGHNARPNT
jgi:probable rRNA maturation factor